MEAITFHKYYFAPTGKLFGLKPGTSTVLSCEGPFKKFNKSTRILEGTESNYYLPEKYAEGSKNPDLYQQTLDVLNKLSL